MNGALFGYGRAGKIHFKNIIDNSNTTLHYIYETKERVREVSKEVYNINPDIIVTSSLETILQDNIINFCVICTPTDQHHDLIMECLDYNKHVFCEKPISLIEEEIEECYQFAASKDLILLCALNRRFDPKIMQLKEDIKTIGTINKIITVSRDYPYPSNDYLKISAGLFADCAVHDIDFVNWLLDDKPITVYASGKQIMPNNIGAGELDTATIIMEYDYNITASLNLSRISTNYDQRIEVYGSDGMLSVKNPYDETPELFDEPISFGERYAQSYKNELEHFCNVIMQYVSIKINVWDCLNAFSIVKACETSIQYEKKIHVKY